MKKSEIIQAIDNVKTVVSINSKDVTDIDSYLFFINGRLGAFNSGVAISLAFDVGFDAAVPAVEFMNFIKKIPYDEFDLELGNNEITVNIKNINAGFRTVDIISEIPELGVDKVEKWIKVPVEFNEALQFCYFSIDDDISSGVIACAYVYPGGIVGTDNLRMTEYFFRRRAVSEFSFYIPKKTVKSISSFECQSVGFSEGWTHIETKNGAVISVRKVDGDYPEYSSIFDVEKIGELLLPQNISDVMERASVIDSEAVKGMKEVMISANKGEIVCRSEGVKGWVEEKLSCEYDGDDISFSTNPDFFTEIVKFSHNIIIGNGRILVKGQNFRHVAALAVSNKE